MKKRIIMISLIILVLLFSFIIYKSINYKKYVSNLEKYVFVDNEIIIKKLEYNNKNYVISRYYDNSSSWSHLNLLLKDNDNYYILKNIKNVIHLMMNLIYI